MINNNFYTAIMLEDSQLDKLPPPQALVVDLDLTLYNVIKHYDYCVNQTLIHFGKEELSQQELDKLGGNNFNGSRDFFVKFIGEEIADKSVQYYFEHFIKNIIPQDTLIPGAKELLYLVKKRFRIPIIALTNCEEFLAIKILHDLNIFQLFDQVIGIGDNLFLKKPNTHLLFEALKNINIQPGPHIWFMGDLATDTQCAREANCTAIRFYHDLKPDDKNADYFINSHYHLFNIISSKFK